MYALERFGITETNREKLYCFIGPPLVESFQKYYGFSFEEAQRALGIYREYFSVHGLYENTVYEGCEAFLKALQKKNIPLVLASSKPEVYVKRILKHFSLDGYFTFIGGSDLEETRVRKADVLSYCMDSLKNVDPSSCVMIGDRLHDVLGAKAHGMKSIGVLYGYGSKEELINAGADYVARDFKELEQIIFAL